ncbi:MAG: potassium transporter TrkG [Candidatus Cloacimonadales bacterium]
MIDLLFEIVSAFGTVGLSTGITASLDSISKVMIIVTMFVGRLGPLAIGSMFIGKNQTDNYSYTEGEFFVG